MVNKIKNSKSKQNDQKIKDTEKNSKNNRPISLRESRNMYLSYDKPTFKDLNMYAIKIQRAWRSYQTYKMVHKYYKYFKKVRKM